MNRVLKIILASALLSSVSALWLPAQDVNIKEFFEGMNRKQILRENEELKRKLDSLQTIIDEMCEQALVENGVAGEDSVSVEYTAELTDSLLSSLYENRREVFDFNEEEQYDMDSVRFSTNVSDSVLISRLKLMNSYISVPFNGTVKNYMVLYSEKMPEKMSGVLGLSQYYFPIFETAFDKYGLPLELKYMAVVESMLNSTAKSRAGAYGMWQFMYTTGKMYGLKINSFVDERLDVEKAADAAARYLQDAYNVFGDWTLAISSYNCGLGNVNKAIRRAGGKRDFWSIYPYLPRETRGYVPAFVGAMYAMTYSKEYGIVPKPCPIAPAVDTVMIDRNIHFNQISSVVGIPLEELKTLNPQYTHNIIPGNEGVQVLRIPFNWTGSFISTPIDSISSYKSGELLSEQVIKNIKASGSETRIAYKVKSGDYLGRIASKYGVSVSQLKKWNNLKSNNIRVGQTLYIYRGGAAPASSSTSSSSAKPATSTNASGETIYTVKSGDSLYTIAKKFPGISANDIMKYNGISSNIRPGMKLKIPRK